MIMLEMLTFQSMTPPRILQIFSLRDMVEVSFFYYSSVNV